MVYNGVSYTIGGICVYVLLKMWQRNRKRTGVLHTLFGGYGTISCKTWNHCKNPLPGFQCGIEEAAPAQIPYF